MPAMETFPTMIVAVSTPARSTAMWPTAPARCSATSANPDLTYVTFDEGQGFTVSAGRRADCRRREAKGSPLKAQINEIARRDFRRGAQRHHGRGCARSAAERVIEGANTRTVGQPAAFYTRHGGGERWGAAPSPAKNLRFLDFPLCLSLRDKRRKRSFLLNKPSAKQMVMEGAGNSVPCRGSGRRADVPQRRKQNAERFYILLWLGRPFCWKNTACCSCAERA